MTKHKIRKRGVNLRRLFRCTIFKQYADGIALNRQGKGHYYQKTHGHTSYYKAIWSTNSKRALLGSVERVSNACKKLGIKGFTKDNYKAQARAIFDEEKKHYGNGTLSQDMRMLNHYLVGTDIATYKGRLVKKDMGFGPRSSDILKQKYKSLSSMEWIKENPEKYRRWEQPIKFIQDTGLRRAELRGYKLFNIDDQLNVLTIGKNGKVRFAEVREGKELEVMKFSGVSEVPKITRDQATQIVNNKGVAKKLIDQEGQSIHLSSHIPSHIHRAYYAQQLSQELTRKNDYSGEAPYKTRRGVLHGAGEDYTIGAFTAQYGAWREVSESLGHNRLDVMRNYCGIGR